MSDVPEAEPAGASPPRRRTRWRDNVEALVMAVAMALFLKHFVVEAYKIPTGSMQPTLIGDEGADVKDRILVDKLSYAVRDPKRWEVAVFRYPLDRSKNFVKRIAGVGPEELRFENGDLWHRAPVGAGEWSIVRRPPSVMREHWRRLDALEPADSRWVPQDLPASSRWTTEGRAIEARGRGTAAFRGGRESILDGYFDGYPEELLPWLPPRADAEGANPVGDLRVEGTLRALGGTQSFAIVLREDVRRYRFELPGPAAPDGALARIDAGPSARAGGEARPSSAYRLPAGRAVRFAAENLDDRLALEIDGEELLALEILPAAQQFSTVTLELEGEGADLAELMVSRDVFYETRTAPIEVPEGSYYMLGDNTQDSSDSRDWAFVVYDVEQADGGVRRMRGNHRDGENPRTVGYGEEGGPFTYFADEWGERHWFRSVQGRLATPEPAPFVPRSLVQGKALAVFWPLDPLRGIWRLKWVN